MAIQTQLFLVYGEIHGIKENADIIYTLVRHLEIKKIAIENSPNIAEFIQSIGRSEYDFSLIDPDTFDSSILSLEVAKTLGVLHQEGQLEQINYVDTYFDNLNPSKMDHPASPQLREQLLADYILQLDRQTTTLCLLGQWHTQPAAVKL